MKITFKLLVFGLLISFYSLVSADSARPRLNVWVHGTTIRAAVPVKLAKFHYSTKFMHSSELVANRGACPRAEVLAKSDPENFPLDSFYLFRWSGLLNHKERQTVSYDLYQALMDKIAEIYSQTGKYPFVTVITHSHGGNIALNLAQINELMGGNLQIDRLILLACPVQQGTAKFVDSAIFGKVYAFYSTNDMIQVMALQRFLQPAARKFSKLNCGKKVLHVKTSWKKYGLLHNDFKGLNFLAKLPGALQQIEQDIAQQEWDFSKDYHLQL